MFKKIFVLFVFVVILQDVTYAKQASEIDTQPDFLTYQELMRLSPVKRAAYLKNVARELAIFESGINRKLGQLGLEEHGELEIWHRELVAALEWLPAAEAADPKKASENKYSTASNEIRSKCGGIDFKKAGNEYRKKADADKSGPTCYVAGMKSHYRGGKAKENGCLPVSKHCGEYAKKDASAGKKRMWTECQPSMACATDDKGKPKILCMPYTKTVFMDCMDNSQLPPGPEGCADGGPFQDDWRELTENYKSGPCANGQNGSQFFCLECTAFKFGLEEAKTKAVAAKGPASAPPATQSPSQSPVAPAVPANDGGGGSGDAATEDTPVNI